jgi:two-component system LytT family sensor kinase
MRPNYFNRYLFILIPLVAIVITGVFLISYGAKAAGQSFQIILHGTVMTAGLWLGCMAIVMFLWKRFPWEQAPVRHLLLEILLILLYTVTFSSILYLLEKKFLDILKIENLGMEVFITILITLFITSIHESVFFYQQWTYNFSKSIRLEKDNIEARYEALRAQINPHFLFNSLNSLTTMIEENRNAVDYIQNLSELLRYMLKSGEKELVLLRDEITILQKYISLQQMRFPGTLDIKVVVDEKYYHFAVPPLALQMLVENSLKHNVISGDNPLKIEVLAERDSITVTNNLQKKEGVQSSGQGLKNLIGRYRFFTQRPVEIICTDKIFKVIIPLLQVEL